MGGGVPLSTLLVKVLGEILAHILTALIRVKTLDLRAVLSESPGCEVLVSLECFTLGFEEASGGVMGVFVSECDVILVAS